MSRWPDLRHRVADPELMDDFSIGGHELRQALAELRTINWLLGSAWPTLEGVQRLWRWAGQPSHLTILDIGAGSGDTSQVLLHWASQHGVAMQITLVDLHRETCAVAAAYHQGEPRVQVRQGDLFALEEGCADIVTASLFLHHIPDAQLPEACLALYRAARIGVVINDLHRNRFAWAFILVATRLLSRNRMIRHDAPLSVRRGFRAADLQRLRDVPGLSGLRYAWRPLFRYLVILPKSKGAADAA